MVLYHTLGYFKIIIKFSKFKIQNNRADLFFIEALPLPLESKFISYKRINTLQNSVIKFHKDCLLLVTCPLDYTFNSIKLRTICSFLLQLYYIKNFYTCQKFLKVLCRNRTYPDVKGICFYISSSLRLAAAVRGVFCLIQIFLRRASALLLSLIYSKKR